MRIVLRREQNLAVIEIKDKGIGIQEELLPRIFDLYFTTKKTGSGIGLATTYRILQMHGGALDVRSTTMEASEEHGSVVHDATAAVSGESGHARRCSKADQSKSGGIERGRRKRLRGKERG